MKIRIPEPIEHIDCPLCVGGNISSVLQRGSTPACRQRCGGEGVIRADGKPTLKTKLGDGYTLPAIRMR